MDRTALAELWHLRAKVKRADVFGSSDEKLRPIAAPDQVDVSVPGMVGRSYQPGGVIIISVNPAGGRDGFSPTIGDAQLYAAATALKDTCNERTFETLNDAFTTGMPHWGPQWRVILSILHATGVGLDEIAYPYLVPFRSRGDAGSALPKTVVERGYTTGFSAIVKALRPGHIVAVDRPSEGASYRLRDDGSTEAAITYLTRKRDAHAERAETLRSLSTQFRKV